MHQQASASSGRPRVLILGGGFAGVAAARALEDAAADVVVVDRHDHHTFQPLLYQVATSLLDTAAVADPLRDLFRHQANVVVQRATVSGVDLERREVAFDEMEPLGYDYLVLAVGAQVNFFGVDGAAEHGFPLYTLGDAIRLNEHVLERWAAVDRDPSLAGDGALNVVVVGGGATGVETAGALAELYAHELPSRHQGVDRSQARLTLVEAGSELFTMFAPSLRRYAKAALEKRGVEVLVGEVVESVTPTRITLKSGTVLPAHTLVWGAGLQASTLARSLGVQLERGYRVPSEADLSHVTYPEVFPVGDVAAIPGEGPVPLPQLGSVAMQSGETAGANIARRLKGEPTKPFAYHDKGTMAMIGRGAAVVQLPGGRTMKGRSAFLAWGAVHLALLSTTEDRAKAVTDWTWAGLTHKRGGHIAQADEREAMRARTPVGSVQA
jgi:NADH dehydrogenase